MRNEENEQTEWSAIATSLFAKLSEKSARIGVIGLGYVGLPLAVTAARRGFRVVGFDIDPQKPEKLNGGDRYIDSVKADELSELRAAGHAQWTADFEVLAECDAILICVPTPLGPHREPDLSMVESTGRTIAKHLSVGTLVVLESTSYPGTTREVLAPILGESGLELGKDFFVGFSPEREDPGNAQFSTATIPKIVAGDGPIARDLVSALYSGIVDKIVAVSTTETAEAVKITENIFRAVNIAMVNELKVIFDAMGVDIWEVIDAAATKPFGYMPFYPGPGLGGHCIPIDPFYLTWKAREFDLTTRFIELAGEINVQMPEYVVARLRQAMDLRSQRGLSGSRLLIVGIAYKKNVSDMRESPSMRLMEMLIEHGASVDFHDPLVPEIPEMRNYPKFAGNRSVSVPQCAGYDAVLIATDHDTVDYQAIVQSGVLIVDTRNAIERRSLSMANVVKA